MIVRQTTTIVFEYPQDYLQEQEWCKTKEDRWVHKGTDTLCAVYENQISYSIGTTADRKTEPSPCIFVKGVGWKGQIDTEPQTDDFFREPTAEERKAVAEYIESISVPTGVNIFDLMDEPQTDCRRCGHYATDKCKECSGYELFTDSGYVTDCSWR